MIAEGNKRRTVTRADISQAAGQSDMFDFLIDFLPPDERKGSNGSKRSRGIQKDGNVGDGGEEKTASHSGCRPDVGAPRRAPKGSKKAQANSVAIPETQTPLVSRFSPSLCSSDIVDRSYRSNSPRMLSLRMYSQL